jgi:hypothetical protein
VGARDNGDEFLILKCNIKLETYKKIIEKGLEWYNSET